MDSNLSGWLQAARASGVWEGVSLVALGVAAVSFLRLAWLHRSRTYATAEMAFRPYAWLPAVAVRWFVAGTVALLVGVVAGVESVQIPIGHFLPYEYIMGQGYALAQAARTSGIPWEVVGDVALWVEVVSLLGAGGLLSAVSLFPVYGERPRREWLPRIIAGLFWIGVVAGVVAGVAGTLAE